MNILIMLYCVKIIGCAILGFAPFEKKRIRARWAKLIFILIAIIGVSSNTFGLLWELNLFSFNKAMNYRLEGLLHLGAGLVLGFLLSLIFSGQLTGAKRDLNNPQEN